MSNLNIFNVGVQPWQGNTNFQDHWGRALRQVESHRGEVKKSAVAGHCARKNDTQMKTLSEIMSHQSKEEYLESCRERYPSRNRAGKTAMINEISDTFGWDRKHAIKAINRQVTHGRKAQKRGSYCANDK
jgi:hypothetical protein